MIRSVLVLSWDAADFTSWKTQLNGLGTSFMECNIATPSSIHTADAGTSSTGWALYSRMCSSADFAVFVGAPSAVARDHDSVPSGYVNTSCMFICR